MFFEYGLLGFGQLFRPGLNLLQTEHIRMLFCLPIQPILIEYGSQTVYIPGNDLKIHYTSTSPSRWLTVQIHPRKMAKT